MSEKNNKQTIYLYASHMDGIYPSDIDYDYDVLYCDQCGDADSYLATIEDADYIEEALYELIGDFEFSIGSVYDLQDSLKEYYDDVYVDRAVQDFFNNFERLAKQHEQTPFIKGYAKGILYNPVYIYRDDNGYILTDEFKDPGQGFVADYIIPKEHCIDDFVYEALKDGVPVSEILSILDGLFKYYDKASVEYAISQLTNTIADIKNTKGLDK